MGGVRGKKLRGWIRGKLRESGSSGGLSRDAFQATLRKEGLWDGDAAQDDGAVEECDLRTDLRWIGLSFFDLSRKRTWLGAGFGAVPQPIATDKIREHFHCELGLKGASNYQSFRRLIDKLDHDWLEDWREREEARREEEKREAEIRRLSHRRH